ncbi:hypothetical protein JB92DRAFT_2871734 [Gautieria morchelliformis]|nr:hypothetical protein JB92DRAFT_2871734 [Gautieria morchelliformis]
MRLIVCGNDMAVQFFDLAVHTPARDGQRLHGCGVLRLDTCMNHGEPLPPVPAIIPGASLACEALATYTFPMPRHQAGRLVLPRHTTRPYVTAPHSHIPRHHTFPATHRLMPPHACFSTAWTSDSLKFTVAAQEGALAIWDVRSSVPVWVFWAGLRGPSGSRGRMRRRAAPAGWGTNAWAIHDRTHVFTFVKRPINRRKEFLQINIVRNCGRWGTRTS